MIENGGGSGGGGGEEMGRPPRRRGRWGRRIALVLVVIPFAVVIGHAIWGYSTGSGLQQRIAAIQARGEPILPADFKPPALPPEQNGGPDIDAAGDEVAAYMRTAAGKPLGDVDFVLPLLPAERTTIEQAIQNCGGALAQFRQGRAKPRHEPTLVLTSPVLANIALSDNLNGRRALCMLFRGAALLDHEKGDSAAALRHIDDIIFVSRYTDKVPSLVGHLVAIGCTALATESCFELAPDLRIGTSKGDATPADVRKMIDTLLDDAPLREGMRRAFRGERMLQYDAMDSMARGVPIQLQRGGPPTAYRPVARYLTGPMFKQNARAMLDHMTTLLPVVDEADLPAAQAKLPAKPKGGNPLNVFVQILVPSLERAVETQHRVNSDRRLAATVLAIRWYQLDHNGQRPAKLADLVPKYLPSVPKDSLVRDQPLGYLPDTNRPRLYCAGANNVDDGGSDAYIRPYPDGRSAQRGDEWSTLDRCVFLDRQPRRKPEPEMTPEVLDLPMDEGATTAPTTLPEGAPPVE